MLGAQVCWMLLGWAVALPSAPALGQSYPNQEAVVFIEPSCRDPDTGGIVKPVGSGFIFESSGLILTAYHVVSCKDTKAGRQLERTELGVKIGSPNESARKVDVVAYDDKADVAVLKILGLSRTYKSLGTCALRKVKSGLEFVAAGFPEGSGYQPVPGVIGHAEMSGGQWGVASAFTNGMSGGPILHKGFVVGLVKGGTGDTAALRSVVPIYKASLLAQSETGRLIPECNFVTTGAATGAAVAVPKAGGGNNASFVRKFENAWVEGEGYSKTTGTTYAKCENACIGDDKCKQFEFYRPTKTCNLFSAEKAIGSADDADVGVKMQAGSTGGSVVRAPDLKLWNHNGSVMTLEFDGSTRRFVYREPKAVLQKRGVKRGTVLFEGKRAGPEYSGTSRLFRGPACGEFVYKVAGLVAPDQKSVTLEGMAPVVDNKTCKVTGTEPDKLVFSLIE